MAGEVRQVRAMHLDNKEYAIILVGVAFIVLACYVARDRTDNTGQPRYQTESPVMASMSVAMLGIDGLDTGDHYFHPAHCVPGQTQIYTAHKYPAVTGGNISTLIHHGMDRLSKPAPQDDDWLKRPPAEVMF
jgi:hypothetical protein